MAKILQNTLEYQLEKSQQEFQENISALIEFQGDLAARVKYCRENKRSTMFSVEEGEGQAERLLKIISELMVSYALMSHACRHGFIRQTIADRYAEYSLLAEVKEMLARGEEI